MMMMKTAIKYTIGVVIAGIVIYNSLYFRPLDEKLSEGQEIMFDAKSFVDGIWENDLFAVYESAMDLTELIEQLEKLRLAIDKAKGYRKGI